MDVVRNVNESNLILPAGDVKIGPYDYNVYSNGQINGMKDLNRLPLKTVGDASVMVADIGKAEDSHQIQYNKVRVNGQGSVYLPVLKQGGDSNTIAVVNGVKKVVAKLLDVPKKLETQVVFDQSVFVKSAIENLIHEGLIGLVLTGIMILLFLGSMRATAAVFLSIPLSALATFIALSIGGGTINTMILGGLALAFSRLIDNSVVVLENIFRHLELREPPVEAAERGGEEVALPVLAATLTLVVEMFPVTLLFGVSKYLFSALGLTLVLSLFASYIVALTVVPVFCANLIKGREADNELAEKKGSAEAKKRGWGQRFNQWFNLQFKRLLDSYERALNFSLERPWATVIAIGGIFVVSLALFPLVGKSYFPRTDPDQFLASVKARSGTRLEITDQLIGQLEQIVREVVPKSDLKIIVSNIGITPGFNSILNPNSAPHTAVVQVGLNEGHKLSSFAYMDLVRARMRRELPQLSGYFQAGGLVSSILNQGMPAPLDIQVSGMDMNSDHKIATEIARQVSGMPGVSDVLVPQDVDYPSLNVEIDRERASELGLTAKELVDSLITAMTSNGMIAPSYWIDPKTGNNYLLTVQYPEDWIKSIQDLGAMPLRAPQLKQPTRLDSVVHFSHILTPTEVDHYQIQRVVDVYVRPAGEDLSRIYADVQKIIAQTKLPENTTVTIRGSVESMRQSFQSFAVGLSLAVVLIYLILVAQFKSYTDPFMILLAVPPAITGVLLILCLTGTPINVMSLMGMLLAVGISLSNSILIVEFINRLRADGRGLREAVVEGPRVRLRPVLMTSLATLMGLMPMAAKIGSGGEAYAPLARAVIGGLAVSAVLSLFLVPACYFLLHRRKKAVTSSAPAERTEVLS